MALESDWPLLTGAGFELRVLGLDDAASWKAGEDDEQRRWFEMPGPAPMENVVDAIERWRDGWRTDGATRHWGIWVDGALAGGVEVRVRDDRRANVSYIVFPTWRRRGVASAAVSRACAWALEHLPVTGIVAVIHPQNEASRRVASRAGFVEDGWAAPWEYGESGPMRRYVLERTGE